MAKKLLGKHGIFAEVFGGGRVSKRKASAAGYALEEWGKSHHKRKKRKKSAKRRKGHAARKSKRLFGGLAYMAGLAKKPRRRRKSSSRKHKMPKRNSKGRFIKKR